MTLKICWLETKEFKANVRLHFARGSIESKINVSKIQTLCVRMKMEWTVASYTLMLKIY